MANDDVPFSKATRAIKQGYLYESGNGQLVFDQHPADEEHLRSPATRDKQPLYDCRTYLKDLIPETWRERHGSLVIDRVTLPDGEVVAVSLSFVPRERVH